MFVLQLWKNHYHSKYFPQSLLLKGTHFLVAFFPQKYLSLFFKAQLSQLTRLVLALTPVSTLDSQRVKHPLEWLVGRSVYSGKVKFLHEFTNFSKLMQLNFSTNFFSYIQFSEVQIPNFSLFLMWLKYKCLTLDFKS